jgi:hypothetical protein
VIPAKKIVMIKRVLPKLNISQQSNRDLLLRLAFYNVSVGIEPDTLAHEERK